MLEDIVALAVGLRERVRPLLGDPAARQDARGARPASQRRGSGGDVTFAIDAAAEDFLEAFVAERLPDVAFYSEDRGLVEPARPARTVLVVDPIDGTRPALAGFESACVSIAAAPLGDKEPTLADVTASCVIEIKSGARFVARRGHGVRASVPMRPSANRRLDRLFWGFGLRGRPARASMEVLGDLIDRSSVGGGAFALGSQAYAMTRVLTGQLDAVIEVGSRMIDEVPELRGAFERIGGGQILNNSPYDVAAAALCLTEGGTVVTDGWGRPLDDRPLLGSGHPFQVSSIASANQQLHTQLVDEVDRGVARLRAWWSA